MKLKSDKKMKVNRLKVYEVPKGVVIPVIPRSIIGFLLIGIGLLIIGFKFNLLLIPSSVCLLASISMMVFNKDYKNSYYTQMAINNYKIGNFNKSYKCCNKALQFDENNKSVRILKNNIDNIVNTSK